MPIGKTLGVDVATEIVFCIGPFTKEVEEPPLTVAPLPKVSKFEVVVVNNPELKVNVPLTVIAPAAVTPLELLIFKLPKVFAFTP